MFKATFVKLPPKRIKYRCYKNFDKSAFESDLIGNIRLCSSPSDYNSLETSFQQTLDKHAPFKVKVLRGNNKPFLTKDMRKAIANRSKLKNIANLTNDPMDFERYKRQRNFVKNLTFKTKRDYYKALNPKKLIFSNKFWKTFKPLLSNKVESAEKMLLVENENIITEDAEIANIMNNHFSKITDSLNIKNWPEPQSSYDTTEDSITVAILKYANHPSIVKIKSFYKSCKGFKFKNILPEDVKLKVNDLNIGKSSRGDIPTQILKESIDIINVNLTDCINACINDGNFPDPMKLADITPIFKKDEKTEKKNYRPISILSSLSKVFERLLCDQLNTFMVNKFSPYLCGFRKGFNCEDALLRLLENWRHCLDNGEIVGTILCDLSKAFDTLPHDLIIAKLEAYGMSNDALKLISSYLTNRMQRCKIGSSYSDWVDILIGVPQGSVLGPLLFNIFINDFFLFMEDVSVCNFADDTTIYTSDKSLINVVTKLEEDIENVIEWFQNNSLVPNPDKFQIMFLGAKSKIRLCLDINGRKTISTSEVTLLGITIDWKLQFNRHVEYLCEKARKKTATLMRLRNKLDVEQKLILYNSFIKSQFGYCPIVWLFHGKVAEDQINRIHKRALKAVYNDFDSTFETLLAKGNHETVHQANLKQLIIKVFSCVKKESPAILQDIFTIDNCHHNLRINNRLKLPKTNSLTYGLQSFSYRGSSIWNSLPDIYKNCTCSSVLKTELKTLSIVKCSCINCS